MEEVPRPEEMRRTTRDPESLRVALSKELPGYEIGPLAPTSATGMSSETYLFDATRDGEVESLVARVAPAVEDVPVFPSYDLPAQFRTIETVAERSEVPVPKPWFCAADPQLMVMGQIDGIVPPDVMPYNFGDSWLFNASAAEQSLLQESSVGILVGLHAIENPSDLFEHLGESGLRAHFARRQAWYEFAAGACGRSSLVEKGFAWLEDHWPSHESDAVLSWGDSRIGNVLYREFQPVGVLDWEMAAVGPPELDVAWMVHIHRMFEDLAHQFELPGMPGFLRPEDAAASYERLSGRTPRDLDWYMTYACVQMGVVFMRTGWRQVHFGERETPSNADELLINAGTISAMIS